ncbi:helix-turn-helix domain-containing protein [Paenalcaligenes suwonensis]|uniref:helix-turn-helix domain-containing protein n=1 Tax=Paenalcaligenes suwonensis TaxID=1202713 RepID=UPI00140D7114|nr:XRE family transcriptional regulator [Paenalcaligenes suwonensis]NHC60361.1 helix-turn-helix domain-containing protein [Paenalcaligenes suwonensis]
MARDTTSLPHDPPPVGQAIQAIRAQQKLSLDALSKRSGVSKSMLSQIERNLTNPTIAVLWRLAQALEISVGDILGLGMEAVSSAEPNITLQSAHSTPVIKNKDGTCELRILGPIDLAGITEWYALTVEPGGVLASEPHEAGTQEHLTVLSGLWQVKSGNSEQQLHAGETARYPADQPHVISNIGTTAATAWLVVESIKR